MRRIMLLLVFTLLTGTNIGYCQKSNNTNWDYSVECAGTAKDGSYIVGVTTNVKKMNDAQKTAMKAAVHAVLFRGIDGTAVSCVKHAPMISNSATNKEQDDFFNTFFSDKNGAYQRFVFETPGTVPSSTKIKKGYRVETTMTVMKDQLRKYLEDNGIIRALSTGF